MKVQKREFHGPSWVGTLPQQQEVIKTDHHPAPAKDFWTTGLGEHLMQERKVSKLANERSQMEERKTGTHTHTTTSKHVTELEKTYFLHYTNHPKSARYVNYPQKLTYVTKQNLILYRTLWFGL